MEHRYEDGYDRLPFFLELNPGTLHFKRMSGFFIDEYFSWRLQLQFLNTVCWGMVIQTSAHGR
jgi:hypothetical protein